MNIEIITRQEKDKWLIILEDGAEVLLKGEV